MARITYKEIRGDRYLGLHAQRDGKYAGYAIVISWMANNDGGLFSRNFNAAPVYVRVTKDGGAADGRLLPDIVLFEAEAGRARYQRDAYKLARAFVRERGLKAMIERELGA